MYRLRRTDAVVGEVEGSVEVEQTSGVHDEIEAVAVLSETGRL
jgi:hypothetical protein